MNWFRFFSACCVYDNVTLLDDQTLLDVNYEVHIAFSTFFMLLLAAKLPKFAYSFCKFFYFYFWFGKIIVYAVWTQDSKAVIRYANIK